MHQPNDWYVLLYLYNIGTNHVLQAIQGDLQHCSNFSFNGSWKIGSYVHALQKFFPGDYSPHFKNPCWYSKIRIPQDVLKTLTSMSILNPKYYNTQMSRKIVRDTLTNTHKKQQLYCLPAVYSWVCKVWNDCSLQYDISTSKNRTASLQRRTLLEKLHAKRNCAGKAHTCSMVPCNFFFSYRLHQNSSRCYYFGCQYFNCKQPSNSAEQTKPRTFQYTLVTINNLNSAARFKIHYHYA